jgi:transcriptional regulator with XRE-family HTH domain
MEIQVENDANLTFGERVRKLRKSLGILQKEFAESLHIAITTLSDIETGKNKPCHDFFYHIADVYNVNIHYLLFGKGEVFRSPGIPLLEGEKDDTSQNRDIREFFDYFCKSRLVRYLMLGYFRKIISSEKETIEKDII